jgi:hypothetical protein
MYGYKPANRALHMTVFPLHSKAAGELGRFSFKKFPSREASQINKPKAVFLITSPMFFLMKNQDRLLAGLPYLLPLIKLHQ